MLSPSPHHSHTLIINLFPETYFGRNVTQLWSGPGSGQIVDCYGWLQSSEHLLMLSGDGLVLAGFGFAGVMVLE